MKKIGYARVSSSDQNLDRQIAALRAEGCNEIYREKVSGKSVRNRPELEKAIDHLGTGDTLVVAEWNRATRSMIDGIDIIKRINDRGSLLKVLDSHIWISPRPSDAASLPSYRPWLRASACASWSAAKAEWRPPRPAACDWGGSPSCPSISARRPAGGRSERKRPHHRQIVRRASRHCVWWCDVGNLVGAAY
jgi:hypothetical protein